MRPVAGVAARIARLTTELDQYRAARVDAINAATRSLAAEGSQIAHAINFIEGNHLEAMKHERDPALRAAMQALYKAAGEGLGKQVGVGLRGDQSDLNQARKQKEREVRQARAVVEQQLESRLTSQQERQRLITLLKSSDIYRRYSANNYELQRTLDAQRQVNKTLSQAVPQQLANKTLVDALAEATGADVALLQRILTETNRLQMANIRTFRSEANDLSDSSRLLSTEREALADSFATQVANIFGHTQ